MFETNNFLIKKDVYDLQSYNQCTKLYVSGFDNAIKLKGDTAIFLDTNILLRYYSISFTARQKLFDFLVTIKDRIYITAQVQKEFLRNREDVIERFFQQVSKKVSQDFGSGIVNQLNQFIGSHNVVLKDYPDISRELEDYKEKVKNLLSQINEETKKKRNENKSLIFSDPFLDLIESFNLLQVLEKGDLDQILSGFNELKKDIDVSKIDSNLDQPNFAFPGLGDLKTKPEDPYGDYIIFHEILKFQKDSESDAIFLTFDNTKGDWMTKNKSPYLHYVYNSYLNTEKILYIVDAERTLENILETEVDSLITTEKSNTSTTLSIEELRKVFLTHKIFTGVEFPNEIKSKVLGDLDFCNISTVDQVEKLLDKYSYVIDVIKETFSGFNRVGILRVCLRLEFPKFLDQHIAVLPKDMRDIHLKDYLNILDIIDLVT